MVATEVDLSCSESSADFSSPDPSSPSVGSGYTEPKVLMEYHFLDRAEASTELQRLLSTERQTMAPPLYLQNSGITSHGRTQLVDLICMAGENLNFSFTTKSLAINLMDRYLASIPQLLSCFLTLAAVGSLSIAAKMEEVYCQPTITQIQYAMFCNVCHLSSDIKRMELAILSALRWRTLGVTPANLLDPLICSLDCQDSSFVATGGYKQLYILRESCKLILAKALRDSYYLEHRPSSVAAAAIFIVLENMSAPAKLLSIAHPLEQLFSTYQNLQIRACQLRMRATLGVDHIHPDLHKCKVEVAADTRVVRVYRQQEGNVTPTSVLQSAGYWELSHCSASRANLPLDYADARMGSLEDAFDLHLAQSNLQGCVSDF